MKKTLAVLLTVYNRKSTTLQCLNRLYQQHIPDDIQMEVWLTDDGCTDGTPEAVKQSYADVHIIKGDGNLFWNRGMHAAWEAAEVHHAYDYFLWLNDDTILKPNAIEHLLKTSKEKGDKCIIVGYTTNSAGDKITYGGRDANLSLITQINGITPCATFNGNIVLFPKYVHRIVGKNDPFFNHGMGDTDYGLRARKMGIASYVAPQVAGKCNTHDKLPKWADPHVPICKRFSALYAPGGNGNNPIEFFVFTRRHRGMAMACLIFISNHIHALLPSLWKRDASNY